MSDEVVYHHAPKADEVNETTTTDVEQSDRGLFDFMSKKKEEENKSEEAAISSEFDQKVQVSHEPEPKAEEKHETLFQKMHGSSSSSSSDEECEDGEKKEKKKKKKSLTTQIQEKIEERKEKKEDEKHEDDTSVPVEQYVEVSPPPHVSEVAHPIPTPEPEEKKGFMEKLKEKLPGGHKKAAEEEQLAAPPPPSTPAVEAHDEDKEKKGILEKIKEKIPGYHSKSEEEKEKEKVKECD